MATQVGAVTHPPKAAVARGLWTLIGADGQRWALSRKDPATREALYPLQQGSLDAKHVIRHVCGLITVGVLCPSKATKYAVIDLDAPRDGATIRDVLTLALELKESAETHDIFPVIEFSGRRGLHIWFFFREPVPLAMAQSVVRLVSRGVYGFEPAEVWPSPQTARKSIKLPCCLHMGAVAWSRFVELPATPGGLDDLSAQISDWLTSGEEPDWQEQERILSNVRLISQSVARGASAQAGIPDLTLLDGEDPLCVTALLLDGPMATSTLHDANFDLARYLVARGIEEAEAIEFAEVLYSKLPEGFTKKDQPMAIKDFVRSYRDCLRNPDNPTLQFRCSNMVKGGPKAAKALVSEGRCAGEACPAWVWSRVTEAQ